MKPPEIDGSYSAAMLAVPMSLVGVTGQSFGARGH
jgi:hypothetical protein